jgi:hypothetical protein
MSRPTFKEACATYVHRFTMEHVPEWTQRPAPNGTYYAPHFETDREWYANTVFPSETDHPDHALTSRNHCYTSGETWPLGRSLPSAYQKA